MGNQVHQGERLYGAAGLSRGERGRLDGGPLRQEPVALPRMHLARREHVQARVRMDVVVPVVELTEIAVRLGPSTTKPG
jgi:hypothetical protein